MNDWDWDCTIHVDYNPPHSAMTFGDSNYQPILFFRNPTESELRNLEHLRSGRSTSGPIPDG
jgi:hypothetical protein